MHHLLAPTAAAAAVCVCVCVLHIQALYEAMSASQVHAFCHPTTSALCIYL